MSGSNSSLIWLILSFNRSFLFFILFICSRFIVLLLCIWLIISSRSRCSSSYCFKIFINSIYITSSGLVDGAASIQIRIVAAPNSKDIVPVRNQVLEIDFINTAITGEVDTVAVGDSAAGTTYTTTSAYTPTSSY